MQTEMFCYNGKQQKSWNKKLNDVRWCIITCEKKQLCFVDSFIDVCYCIKNRFTLGVYRTVSKTLYLWVGDVGFWTQKNRHLFFFENGGDDKNDNHILVENKLSVACSESIKCRGLTIFENEAVKAKTRPSFYSKILR